ncbi:hypothetical protein EV182_006154, partial [Spiromyces aspiralis]
WLDPEDDPEYLASFRLVEKVLPADKGSGGDGSSGEEGDIAGNDGMVAASSMFKKRKPSKARS